METELKPEHQEMSDIELAGEVVGKPVNPSVIVGSATRPARVLLGWMHPDSAPLVSGRADNQVLVEQDRARIEAARRVVAARQPGCDQSGLIEPLPPELGSHVAALQQLPAASAFFSEGWEVAIVDLARVCAFQPFVYTEDALERVGAATDLMTTALITLPLPQEADNLPVRYDPNQKILTMVSRNPNLRVTGMFCGPVNGQPLLGFHVQIMPSFLQVAEYQGRYYLRDGYHRAYGLLQRGVQRVPAFVRHIPAFEQLGVPQGMLPHDAAFGERPPTLQDFLDDTASGACTRPTDVKALVVSALELSLPA